MSDQSEKKRHGFAAMDPARVRAIARIGGHAAHLAGTAHEFTAEEARAAGRKGGRATHANRRTLEKQAAFNRQMDRALDDLKTRELNREDLTK